MYLQTLCSDIKRTFQKLYLEPIYLYFIVYHYPRPQILSVNGCNHSRSFLRVMYILYLLKYCLKKKNTTEKLRLP
jgi:hypothetical protein